VYLAPDAGHEQDLAALVVQTALLRAGSLAPELLSELTGRQRRRAVPRYLALEARRALSALAPAFPTMPVLAQFCSGATVTGSPRDSLRMALGRAEVPRPPAVFGVIRPRLVLELLGSEPDASGLADQETERSELEARQSRSKLLRRLAKGTDKRDDDRGGAHFFIGEGRVAEGARATTHVVVLPATLSPTEAGPGEDASRYPEWDVRRQEYRPQWCTVRELDPPGAVPVASDRPRSSELQSRLARLGVGLEHRRRRPQGDDIDLDAVVEAQVRMRRGEAADDGLYVENLRSRRSLAVLLLIDVSGSAAERGGRTRSVHEHQSEAAALLLEALNSLGDRVAAAAFRSHGRNSVELLRVKAFDDLLDGPVYARLAGLAPGGYTRLGAAIRHGTQVLDTRAGTERRLLVVLSDGFAYDDGYQGAYGEADAARALAEARGRGVGCLCISLGATTDAGDLKRVFGPAAHAAARQFEDLMPEIGRLFRAALAAADLQRRVAQRGRSTDSDEGVA
jgi:Mg-chelatase subunit ChlD